MLKGGAYKLPRDFALGGRDNDCLQPFFPALSPVCRVSLSFFVRFQMYEANTKVGTCLYLY